jgi:hypothetical protein
MVWDSVLYSKYLLFMYILEVYHSIIDVHDYKLLQSAMNSVHNWYYENGMIINVGKLLFLLYMQSCLC